MFTILPNSSAKAHCHTAWEILLHITRRLAREELSYASEVSFSAKGPYLSGILSREVVNTLYKPLPQKISSSEVYSLKRLFGRLRGPFGAYALS